MTVYNIQKEITDSQQEEEEAEKTTTFHIENPLKSHKQREILAMVGRPGPQSIMRANMREGEILWWQISIALTRTPHTFNLTQQ